ncbi:lycopene cyclase domain-containing protein [Microbacterium sp. bgisy207]|uniref:lycopene cyclase domain-containing protein n=1 Tax=Microbacterium sp. bgisy207 TaxID=3413800 RepID=UPI003EB704C2
MTYALIIIPFALITLVVTLVSAPRPGMRQRMLASTISAGVLVVLTAIFDNVMISSGLVAYPEGTSSGIRIGVAPIEDFSYAICAAYLVPAVYVLLPRSSKDVRREHP